MTELMHFSALQASGMLPVSPSVAQPPLLVVGAKTRFTLTNQRCLRHSAPCLPGQIYMYGGRTGRLPSEVYDSKSYQELNVKGMALRSQLLTGWEVSAVKV